MSNYKIPRKKREIHGDSKTDLYQRWSSMINRCKQGRFSKTYYDKGITVCDEWKSYLNFKSWALKNRFDKNLEIDRIDNSKGYCPENCRFVTKIVNNSNRSNTIFINYNGEIISLTLFAIKNNLPKNVYNAIRRRINKGWNHKKAIETPIKKGNYNRKGKIKAIDTSSGRIFNSMKEAALFAGVRANHLSSMLNGGRNNKTTLKKL